MPTNLFLTVFFTVPDASISDWIFARNPRFAINTQSFHSSLNIGNAGIWMFRGIFNLMDNFVFDHA